MDICQNCGAEVTAKYCPHCGQEKNIKRFEVKTLLHEISHGIFHWENSILKTFKLLLTGPGYFINDYIKGKRKSFVKPFSYFLFFQTLYVFVFHWLSGNYFAYMNFTISTDPMHEKVSHIQELVNKNVNYLNFILPLILALVLKIFLRKRTGINYAEGLVFSFYTFATILIFGMLFMLISLIEIRLWNLRFVFNYVYLVIAIMQFAGYKKFGGVLKSTAIVLLSYWLFIILITAVTITYIKYFLQ